GPPPAAPPPAGGGGGAAPRAGGGRPPARRPPPAGEFEESGVVLTARRALASIEGGDPVLFVGVEFSTWDGAGQSAPMDALGRALGRVQLPWPVNLVLLDVAQDPVADWMRERVRPFYTRAGALPT
ncbi:enhanced serine sensitivity protein SseB C-terminal domain-containing protein, partial [Streptomyces sp. NPDC058369]|uniref:enhanced serine sensitivity protein SseB C-terminal domain-containing protein n=1 Tax=Streptomyces sp. NPDC058369 TaxID=3346462 RepID=UPI003663C74D